MFRSRFSGLAGACAVTLFSFVIFTMQEPLAPLLLAASRVDPASIGRILGISYFGSLFVPIPIGIFVRRYGYKVPLAISAVILAGSYLTLGLFPSVSTMLPCLLLIEAAKVALIIGQQLQIGDISSSSDSSSSFGWYAASVYTGQMIGPIASGFLLDRMGYAPVWIIMASIMTAVALGLYHILPGRRAAKPDLRADADHEPPAPVGAPVSGGGRFHGLRDIFTPIAGAAIFASFALVLAIGVRMAFYPVFLSGAYTGTAIGVLIGLRSFGAIGARFLLSPFIRLCGGRVRALLGVMAVLSLGLVLVPLGSGFAAQAANSILFGIAVGIGTPLTMSLTTDYVHRARREISMAIRLTATQLGLFAGPLPLGPAAAAFGYGSVFYISGIFVFLCGIVTAWRLAGSLRPRENILQD